MAEQEKREVSKNADQAQKLADQYRDDIRTAAKAMERTMRGRRACAADPQEYTYKKIY